MKFAFAVVPAVAPSCTPVATCVMLDPVRKVMVRLFCVLGEIDARAGVEIRPAVLNGGQAESRRHVRAGEVDAVIRGAEARDGGRAKGEILVAAQAGEIDSVLSGRRDVDRSESVGSGGAVQMNGIAAAWY